MKLVPYDGPEFRSRKRGSNYGLLIEFSESGKDVMEVVDYHHVDAWHCAASLRASIRIFKIGCITAISRDKRVFLVRTDNKKE